MEDEEISAISFLQQIYKRSALHMSDVMRVLIAEDSDAFGKACKKELDQRA